MGQALYRKYRSKNLAEIVGQEHITIALDNALKQGRVSHAYLFTGPHGVGKTSIARILAHEINKLPYDESSLPIDIIEIDAASNRRIDEVRDLRDKVHIAPTSAKFKVYIIDEVHMLTREAFNALLKTLEEPPAHVVFILATTEAHKLPETIISRTQRYIFRPIDNSKVTAHLRSIADREKIVITDDALSLVAQHGNGSFRDSISLLDQVSNMGKDIDTDDILGLLGIAPTEAINSLVAVLSNGSPKDIVNELSAIRSRGYEAAHVAKQLGQKLRDDLLNGQAIYTNTTDLLGELLKVPAAANAEATLELALLGFNLSNHPTQTIIQPQPVKEVIVEVAAVPKQAAAIVAPKVTETINIPAPKPEQPAPKITADTSNYWPQTLDSVKKQYNTLYGILRMAEPALHDQTLTLTFKFPFHQKRLKESKNQQIVSDIVHEKLGYPVTINCLLAADVKPPETVAEATPTPDSNSIATISNIFGGAEVLES